MSIPRWKSMAICHGEDTVPSKFPAISVKSHTSSSILLTETAGRCEEYVMGFRLALGLGRRVHDERFADSGAARAAHWLGPGSVGVVHVSARAGSAEERFEVGGARIETLVCGVKPDGLACFACAARARMRTNRIRNVEGEDVGRDK